MTRLSQLAQRPYLDVHVCDHCNLRCAGCLHFSPLAPESFLDLEEYGHDLGLLSALEGSDGFFQMICLMGGEPLLHPRVADAVRITRMRFPTTRIMLGTNGILLKRMDGEFWETLANCDVHLAISPYPIKLDYPALVELAASKGVEAGYSTDRTRSTGDKQRFMRLALDAEGGQDPVHSFTGCPFGGVNLQLARGALWSCQVAAHHRHLAERFGLDMRDGPGDSLPLSSIVSLDQIEDFRRRKHPMCRFCNSEGMETVPWRRSACVASEWVASPSSPV